MRLKLNEQILSTPIQNRRLHKEQITLDINGESLNNSGKGPILFPFDGLCIINMEASALSAYQFYTEPGVRINYSDQQIPFKGKKTLYFYNKRGGNINFDVFNRASVRNTIQIVREFIQQRFIEQRYSYICRDSFREWTLQILNVRGPIRLEPGREISIYPLNCTGAHFEVHCINYVFDNMPANYQVSCKIKYQYDYQTRIIEDWFPLVGEHKFKPWRFHWTHTMELFLKNESDSHLIINPDQIYFSGYKSPSDDVLKKISPGNLRSSFLIEGIKVS